MSTLVLSRQSAPGIREQLGDQVSEGRVAGPFRDSHQKGCRQSSSVTLSSLWCDRPVEVTGGTQRTHFFQQPGGCLGLSIAGDVTPILGSRQTGSRGASQRYQQRGHRKTWPSWSQWGPPNDWTKWWGAPNGRVLPFEEFIYFIWNFETGAGPELKRLAKNDQELLALITTFLVLGS